MNSDCCKGLKGKLSICCDENLNRWTSNLCVSFLQMYLFILFLTPSGPQIVGNVVNKIAHIGYLSVTTSLQYSVIPCQRNTCISQFRVFGKILKVRSQIYFDVWQTPMAHSDKQDAMHSVYILLKSVYLNLMTQQKVTNLQHFIDNTNTFLMCVNFAMRSYD